jgi:hypothetical protein
MIGSLCSVGGLIAAAALLLMVLLIFYFAFWRPARKGKVSGTTLLVLLAISAFNLVVLLPCVVLIAEFSDFIPDFILEFFPLMAFLLWWLIGWFPFLLCSLFVLVLSAGFLIIKSQTIFPISGKRPVLSFILISFAIEALYIGVCPMLTLALALIITPLDPAFLPPSPGFFG